jgi:hypothetical protein
MQRPERLPFVAVERKTVGVTLADQITPESLTRTFVMALTASKIHLPFATKKVVPTHLPEGLDLFG